MTFSQATSVIRNALVQRRRVSAARCNRLIGHDWTEVITDQKALYSNPGA
jgi:hypothetical protein